MTSLSFLEHQFPIDGAIVVPMTITALEASLRDAFPDAQIHVDDLAGDGDHYRARIVSAAFRGLTRVKQHQLVYGALKGKVGGELHALALETSTPD
jgi:stress-induced morphogen